MLAGSLVTFLVVTLYYAEGVLDPNATEPVSSSLFPYFGSHVTVDPSTGLGISLEPDPLPFFAAVGTWLLIAAPWRSWRRRTHVTANTA